MAPTHQWKAPGFAETDPGLDKAKKHPQTSRTRVMNADETMVATLLADYQDALNHSDTEAVMRLYASDGVFMPQHSPSSVGTDAIRMAYDAVFAAITLDVTFKVAEIRQLAPDWALARTNSAGTARIKASGDGGPEANQELFVLQKIAGTWKIARYCFSTTNPPRASS
jgi:uncharacterized protein (TIGR02246 family)